MHLGDSQLLGDTVLRHIAVVPQVEQVAVPFGQLPQRGRRGRPQDGLLEAGVGLPHGREKGGGPRGPRVRLRVEGESAVAVPGLKATTDLALGEVEVFGEPPGCGRDGTGTALQLDDATPHTVAQFLHTAGDVHIPGVVAEVPLQLAGDDRYGVALERVTTPWIEPADRFDEADRGDLLEVFQVLTALSVALCDPPGHREPGADDDVLQPGPGGALR